jgi:hypothetical protein
VCSTFPEDIGQHMPHTFTMVSTTPNFNIYMDTITNPIDFTTLHYDAQRSLSTINAGGKSEISEAASIHHFANIFNAEHVTLEMEIKYWCDYKMVDYVLHCGTIDNCDDVIISDSDDGESDDDNQDFRQRDFNIGVSVTRAMYRPNQTEYTDADAECLIVKKLSGLIISRNTVADEHSFFNSLLHIWAQDANIANKIVQALNNGKVDLKSLDIVGCVDVWITVCDHEYIYKNFVPKSPTSLTSMLVSETVSTKNENCVNTNINPQTVMLTPANHDTLLMPPPQLNWKWWCNWMTFWWFDRDFKRSHIDPDLNTIYPHRSARWQLLVCLCVYIPLFAGMIMNVFSAGLNGFRLDNWIPIFNVIFHFVMFTLMTCHGGSTHRGNICRFVTISCLEISYIIVNILYIRFIHLYPPEIDNDTMYEMGFVPIYNLCVVCIVNVIRLAIILC